MDAGFSPVPFGRDCGTRNGNSMSRVMMDDESEDHLDLRDRGLKKQIRKGQAEYRRGKGRDAKAFLAELRRSAAKSKKK